MTDVSNDDGIDALIREGERRLAALRSDLADRRTELPLRFWRQSTHLTTPANDATLARKAVEAGSAATSRMIERLGLTPADLAACLEVPEAVVDQRLERPARAALVMLDGEDAIPPGDVAAAQALDIAATTLAEADWGASTGSPTLRFYRPVGFREPTSIRDLMTLLWRARAQAGEHPFPLDGIIFPKVEHPEEVDLLDDVLGAAERHLGLRPRSIRVGFLVESGWAVARLADIAQLAAPRLASLIFGLADFSADLRLPAIRSDHPVADWCRAEIVAVAGAVGVPAIDGMTLDYPIIDPALDRPAQQADWLRRMRLVFDDVRRAHDLGMQGKWVGHPAQLFAAAIADDVSSDDAVTHELDKLAEYARALEADRGATVIGGVMSDRATDRHARAVLRQATAEGRVPPDLALRVGVISADEVDEARRFHLARHPEV